MAVPYTFGSATTSIPLSQLDSNFATTITLGNTAIQLGNTVTTLNNMTLANVTISSGTSNLAATAITNGTSNVTIASSGGNISMATNGTTAITVDTSQNVGISSTPSAWGAGYPTLQVGGGAACLTGRTGTSVMYLGSNWYYDGTNNKYIISDNATQYYQSNGNHVWRYAASGTAGTTITATEAMRIDSSGRVLVNESSASAAGGQFEVYSNSDAANNPMAIIQGAASGSPARSSIVFYRTSSSSQVGTITTTNTATAYNTSSDYRLKENIASMTGALDKVAQLKPVTYKWKVDGADGEGFIAHELAEVCPHAVSGEKDAVDANGNPAYQGIDTSFLVATLTAAIQEAKALIDTQAETINALTARIVALEAK